jgi:hypothetical protein
MRDTVHSAKDSLQKIGEIWELLQENKFEYEKSVDQVLKSTEMQTSLKRASEALIEFWGKVERHHQKSIK